MGKQLGLSATEIWGKPKLRGFDVEVLCYDILEKCGLMPLSLQLSLKKGRV
jgi:hypothetical protein